MLIKNNMSARELNSFNIDVNVKNYIEIQDQEDLDHLDINGSFRVLGGGSNILMTDALDTALVHIGIKSREILVDSEEYVLLKVGAGENWHETVSWAVEQNYGGIENLSLIPGRCGAAPMQNIGAYGVEIKDVLHSVYVYDIGNKQAKILHASECGFGYRTSNFKSLWKDKYIISAIVLQLSKAGYHKLNTSYGAIQAKLDEYGISDYGIQEIRKAVIEIRRSKLPDPELIGNAGSFFKNPIVDHGTAERIKKQFPDMPSYPDGGKVKLAAGWLIDSCGWKGHTEENGAGSYKNQALVLVNNGNASGKDILALAKKIKRSVKDRFGISLEEEVNIWD